MSSAMPPRPPSRPGQDTKQIAQTMLKELTERGEGTLPSELTIGTQTASLADMVSVIEAFRWQKAVLETLGLKWPSVRLFWARKNPSPLERWVPLDLAESALHGNVDAARSFDELAAGRSQSRAVEIATLAGFTVKEVSVQEADDTFTEVAGEVVIRRLAAPKSSNYGPPAETFSVTTNSDHLNVLFAQGYFVSTQQGFGISTPATRKLPWGCYTFGANVHGRTKFSDTVWTVPDNTSTHLEY